MMECLDVTFTRAGGDLSVTFDAVCRVSLGDIVLRTADGLMLSDQEDKILLAGKR